MSELRKVRRFASLDVPYESVRDRLYGLVGDATEPRIHVHSVCHQDHAAGLPALTRVSLGCGDPASSADPRFEMSSAEVYVSALSDVGTRLEVEGHWTVRPDVALDTSVDCAAAASVEALLETLVERLKRDPEPEQRTRKPSAATGRAERRT
jgi:hypothetical protein